MAKNKAPDMPIVDALADFLMGRCSEEEYIRRVRDARGHIPEEVQRLLEQLHRGADDEPKIWRNRARCRKCGTVLESKSVHDLQTCSCGAVSIDGGQEYLRRLGKPADIEELSE